MHPEINFYLNFGRFKTATSSEKQLMMQNHKAESTNRSTKCYVKCLRDYLFEKNMPELEDIPTEDLPGILTEKGSQS